MKVYRADTGEAYDVSGSSNSTVALVKNELVGLAGVEAVDQILLFDKYKLDDARTLASYNLPSEDKPVFLFNRKLLKPGTPPPRETVLGPIEVRVPPEQPVPHATGLVGTLLKYQHQFLSHLNFAKAVLVAVDSRIALSRRCCAEQDMQAKALEAAIAHLHEHYRQVPPNFEAFREYYLRQKAKHENILESFESDLTRLREVTLHPALRNGGMQTLMDVVSEARLRKWAADCRQDNEQLSQRLQEVEDQIGALHSEVESLTTSLDVNLEGLKEGVRNTGPMRQEVASTKASFSKDHKSVTAKIEDLHRGGRDDGSWEVCDGFDSMKTVHLKQLDRLTKIDSAIAKVMIACAESKTKLSAVVHTRMQNVAVLESRVRDIVNKFLVLREALTRQQQAFSQLFYVRYLPDAYRAALEEVIRRKAFGKQLMATLAQFAQRLAKMRDDESKQRETFLNKYGRYIPKNLIPGLPDELPDFVTAIGKALPSGLDKALPAIEPPDSYVPPASLGSFDSASPPKGSSSSLTSPRTSGTINLGERSSSSPSRASTELSGRLSALEVENARLLAEIQGLKRDKEARERADREREKEKEKRRNEKEREKKNRNRERESEDVMGLYLSPYSSPGSSSGGSGSSSMSGAERKRVEESYQQRIMSLEEKLAETYRQASLADQTREAAEKKVVVMEREMKMMRETLALMEGKLKDWEASKPLSARRQSVAVDPASSGGGADVSNIGSGSNVDVSATSAAITKALRSECEDLRERLNKMNEENRLLVNNLREAHSTLMDEQSRQKRKEEELDTAHRDNSELRERVRVHELRKVALEEQLELASERMAAAEAQRERNAVDSLAARERALKEEFNAREEALEASVREALERLLLTSREKDDLIAQLAVLKDELEKARAALSEREEAERELEQKLAQVVAEKQELLKEQKKVAQMTEEQSQQLAKSLTKARAEREAKKKAAMDVLAQYDMEKLKSLTASTALALSDLTSPTSSLTIGLSSDSSPTSSSSTFTPVRSVVPMKRERSGPLGDESVRQELLAEASRTSQLAEEEQASMEKSINQLEERTRILQMTLSMREKELESKIGEQVEKEAEVTHLRVALEEEKELLHKSLQEKEEQAQSKEHEIARLREAVAQAEGEIQKREKEIDELKQQLDEERRKYQTLAEHVEALKREIEVHTEDNKSESAELNMRLAELYGQLDLKDRKATELTNSNAAKEEMLSALEQELEKVRNDLAFVKKELKQKSKELEEMRNVERTLQLLREESDQTKKALEEKISDLTTSMQRMLALADFKVDDLACFVYIAATGFYEAFNVGAPNYYLSEESLELFPELKKKKDHIIGQVVFVVEAVATATQNPYKLRVGTRFFEVTITRNEKLM